jgi:hypothetical protein
VDVWLTCKCENGALMRGARYGLLLGCVVPMMRLWVTVVCGCSNTVRESTIVLNLGFQLCVSSSDSELGRTS